MPTTELTPLPLPRLPAAQGQRVRAVAAFADPGFPPPEDSVYECRRHAWVRLPPGINTYDRDSA